MFRASISLFVFIINLAFFINCDALIQIRSENRSVDNVGSGLRVKRKWMFEGDDIVKSISDATKGKDNLFGLPLPLYLTSQPTQDYIHFNLYTKKNPTIPQELKINSRSSLQRSHYDASKPTVFITHGWLNNAGSSSCAIIRNAYLSGSDDINVILVDWSHFSTTLYSMAIESLDPVAKAIADLINWLKTIGYLRLNLTTLVGHSLGAHLMGVVGRKTNGVINQIFGLDPASVLFDKPSKLRIFRDCARQVQIIHTNGNQVGLWEPLGHSDFYPNGGMKQPGCYLDPISMGYCSHGRAPEYFAESLTSTIGFKALRCKVNESPYRGECSGRIAIMGGRSNNITYSGRYFTKTNDVSPYARRLVFRKRLNGTANA